MFAYKKAALASAGKTTSNRLFLTSAEFEQLDDDLQNDLFNVALACTPGSRAFRGFSADGCMGFVPEFLDARMHRALRSIIASRSEQKPIFHLRVPASPPRAAFSSVPGGAPPSPVSTPRAMPRLTIPPSGLVAVVPGQGSPVAQSARERDDEGTTDCCEASVVDSQVDGVSDAAPTSPVPLGPIDVSDLKDSGRAELYLSHVRDTVRCKLGCHFPGVYSCRGCFGGVARMCG